jgi:predicted dehydrogenase
MNKENVRFGVIGLGMGAVRCKEISETQQAELIAVCDLDLEKAKKIAEKYNVDYYKDYKEMLKRDDIDVVFVMTPSGLHGEITIDALRMKKNVVVTKPMEVDLKIADKMIEEAKKENLILAVDFECRYSPDNQKVNYGIKQGIFGKLILGECSLKWYRSQQYYEEGNWRGTWKYDGGGSLINQTVHFIDILQWFMGEVEEVVGYTGIYTHKIETEDIGIAILKFKNGALGRITGTTTYPKSLPPKIEVHGERAGIILEGNKIKEWHHIENLPLFEYEYSGPKNIVEDIISAIKNKTKVAVDGEEGKKSLKIIKAIYKSNEMKRPVKLEEL